MKVYPVLFGEDYDGRQLLAIYASRLDAKAFVMGCAERYVKEHNERFLSGIEVGFIPRDLFDLKVESEKGETGVLYKNLTGIDERDGQKLNFNLEIIDCSEGIGQVATLEILSKIDFISTYENMISVIHDDQIIGEIYIHSQLACEMIKEIEDDGDSIRAGYASWTIKEMEVS